jgi:hypothetical protein
MLNDAKSHFYGKKIKIASSAFKKRIIIVEISNNQNNILPEEFF